MAGNIPSLSVFDESIGGALIDAARINVMAALSAFDEPTIVLPGDEDLPPTLTDCLGQAMQWLDAARTITLQKPGAPDPTSLHVVSSGG